MPPAAIPSPPAETFAVPGLPVLCKRGPTCKVHNPLAQNAFDHLVERIKTILGPSSGIDSKDVDVEVLMKAMREYATDEKHWESFAFADPTRNYTRNFVDHGNGKANLLILVWTPGKSSLVHDHAGAHCIMKMLKGSLTETLYDMPSTSDSPLTVRKETTFDQDEVTYISDDIGLHRIKNPNTQDYAVSLHLYTPPWAEKRGCYCFCEKTGKKTLVNMCNYYSVHGKVSTSC